MEFIVPDDPPDVEFAFERLIAYQATLVFRDLVRPAFRATKRGTAELRDQLNRASLSMITNTAEGAGKFSPPDKAHYYSIALGSTTECVSLLQDCATEDILDLRSIRKARYAADAVFATLTGLVNKLR
jgi:four helix bundle protein